MIGNLLKAFLCWIFTFCVYAAPGSGFVLNLILFLQSSQNSEIPSVELQLLDVRLGMPYTKTKERLTEIYGAPKPWVKSVASDVFLLDKKTKSILIVSTSKKDPFLIGAIQVSGTHPIGGLNFFADINLGDPEKDILLKFPRAKADSVLKDGYRHYNIPLSNYSIAAKDGKVASFRIQDEYTLAAKADGKSISLSKNLTSIAFKRGLFYPAMDIDSLTELASDPLRPYCRSRYPLRMAASGAAYLDINLFKNDAESPIPAVFLLDTGCTETMITPELCRKMNCEDLRPTPSRLQNTPSVKAVSWGTLDIGAKDIVMDKFKVVDREASNFNKTDGTLGGDVLFVHPLFINFEQGYLCFPSLPIADVAQALQFKKLPTQHEGLVTRVVFYANKQPLKGGILDSGADVTGLLKKDIDRLKLTKLKEAASVLKADGIHPTFLYGPVTIGWPALGITQKLDKITQEPVEEMPIIGMDFLRHYILSLDLKSDVFYLGE